MPAAGDAQEVGERIEQLLTQVREAVNARTRERVEELVRLLLELHGQGLARVMELLDEHSLF